MKRKIKYIICCIVGIAIGTLVSNLDVFGISIINSEVVSYDNSNGMKSDNVKGAIDELYVNFERQRNYYENWLKEPVIEDATPIYHTHVGNTTSGGECYKNASTVKTYHNPGCQNTYCNGAIYVEEWNGTYSIGHCQKCGQVYYSEVGDRRSIGSRWDYNCFVSTGKTCPGHDTTVYNLSCTKTENETIDNYSCTSGTLNGSKCLSCISGYKLYDSMCVKQDE